MVVTATYGSVDYRSTSTGTDTLAIAANKTIVCLVASASCSGYTAINSQQTGSVVIDIDGNEICSACGGHSGQTAAGEPPQWQKNQATATKVVWTKPIKVNSGGETITITAAGTGIFVGTVTVWYH